MGFAFTPGLTVAEYAAIRRVRRLPLPGRVLVELGQAVQAGDVVAEASLPGDVRPINLAGELGVRPEEIVRYLRKREGEAVEADELLARTPGLWGLLASECRAPAAGTIESVSPVTGLVMLRGQPVPLRRLAYARGTVVDVQPGESATVEIRGTFVQGVFGVGGEACGELRLAVDDPGQRLDADRIRAEHAGCILVGGSLVTAAAVRAAVRAGVCGIVVGGLDDADLRDILGYELGVAITGEEKLGITLVVTEGFGQVSMAGRTFGLLRKRAGQLASINGATQVRAGVIRPEVVIPLETVALPAERPAEAELVLEVGAALRAIRTPYFGRLGRCTGLPVEPRRLPTEAEVRVLEVEFEDGTRAILPRANVELIRQ